MPRYSNWDSYCAVIGAQAREPIARTLSFHGPPVALMLRYAVSRRDPPSDSWLTVGFPSGTLIYRYEYTRARGR